MPQTPPADRPDDSPEVAAGPGRRGRQPGRRAGSPDTRAEIIEAARHQFAARGYDATSLASIAREVGVDATLLTHFFGGKQRLFAATLEAVRPAFAGIGGVLSEGGDDLGRRLARAWFDAWESVALRPDLLSMLRSASTNQAARDVVVATIDELPLRAARENLPDAVAARVPLAMSVLVGVGFTRYVLEAPAMCGPGVDDLVEQLAPALEGLLGR